MDLMDSIGVGGLVDLWEIRLMRGPIQEVKWVQNKNWSCQVPPHNKNLAIFKLVSKNNRLWECRP